MIRLPPVSRASAVGAHSTTTITTTSTSGTEMDSSHISSSPFDAPPSTSWLRALSTAILTVLRHHGRPQRRLGPSLDAVALLVGAVLHAVVPHILFFYISSRHVSAGVLYAAFLLVVPLCGVWLVGLSECRSLRQRVSERGLSALVTGPAWPLRTVSAVLGWIFVTCYCAWRFSIDYYYGYYPFQAVGTEPALALWMLPSAALTLILFLCCSLPRLPSVGAGGTGGEGSGDAFAFFFFVPLGAVLVTRHGLWCCRALIGFLIVFLSSFLYYAYQLAIILDRVEADLADVLHTPPRVPPGDKSRCGPLLLLKPPALIFSSPTSPVFWKLAYTYTTLGIVVGIVSLMAGAVYPLFARTREHESTRRREQSGFL